MRSGTKKIESVVAEISDNDGENTLVERMFYLDCDPEQAVDRTTRVEQVADLIKSSRSFGTLRSQELIREAFQREVEFSRSPVESISRMSRLLALINLQLTDGLQLGPTNLGVYERVYLLSNNAPIQNLELNLRLTEYGKKLNKQSKNPGSAA